MMRCCCCRCSRHRWRPPARWGCCCAAAAAIRKTKFWWNSRSCGGILLASPLAAAATGPGRCDNIYQGFAECLIRLGNDMGGGGELETVCRSWNDFHACASRVLLGCPEEAATVWESLQQEARRAPHPDNLHALCGAPVHVRERGASPETNQETLRATAPATTPVPTPTLLAAALALACLLGPLA